ncbi:MAG: O-antigen flippase, partial [Candidatus Gastranaerophilaceae bacterium]
TSALTVPVAQILVRNYIVDNISLDAAGFWQGIWKISDVYLTIVTTSLSVYYLPKLSEIQSDKELKKEILFGYKILLPIVAIIAVFIYMTKMPIIHLLFTDKFIPMKDLFTFQLIGDFIKIASWLLGILMVAKAMTRWYIAVEIIFNITFVIFSVLFINKGGLIGVTQAFALNYFLCLLFMIWLFRNLLFDKRVKNDN